MMQDQHAVAARSMVARTRRRALVILLAACALLPRATASQSLTGALIGTIRDDQGGGVPRVPVRITSPSLMGGAATTVTNAKGQFRFAALPPGLYTLAIDVPGFVPVHDENVSIGAAATLERTITLTLAGVAVDLMALPEGEFAHVYLLAEAEGYAAARTRGFVSSRNDENVYESEVTLDPAASSLSGRVLLPGGRDPAPCALFRSVDELGNMHITAVDREGRFSLDELRYEYPEEIVPEGHTPASWLRTLTEQGVARRFPQGMPAEHRRTLDAELALIESLKYEPYFLTVADIVHWARGQGILCQGRGSAANSLVCYALSVTEVDPRRATLLFGR